MKKIRLLSAIMICAICLTGCMRVKATIDVKSNGKIDLSMLYATVSFDDDDKSLSDTEKKEYEQEGWTVEEYDRDGFYGYNLTRKNVSIDEVASSIGQTQNQLSDEGGKISFTKTGLLYSLDWQPFSKEQAEQISDYKNYFSMYGGYMKVIVNLPFGALSSNATSVSNNGKTLEWDLLSLGSDPTIHADFILITTSQIIKWGVTAVALAGMALFGLIWTYVKKKKEKNNNEEETTTDAVSDQHNVTSSTEYPNPVDTVVSDTYQTPADNTDNVGYPAQQNVNYNPMNNTGYPTHQSAEKHSDIQSVEKKKSILPIILLMLAAVILISAVPVYYYVFKPATDPYNKLTDEEKNSIAVVEQHISELGEITAKSKDKIDSVEKEYNDLDDTCKEFVKNHDKIDAAYIAYDKVVAEKTQKLIDDISTVSLSSMTSIQSAEKSYNQLTDEQKVYISNPERIQEAYEELSDLKVTDFEDKVKNIGKVTLKSEAKISVAKSAYESLSKEEQAKTTANSTLNKAIKKYDNLIIKKVFKAIDAIGEVTLDKEAAITKAYKLYKDLSYEQAKKVKNRDVLFAAQKRLEEVKAEEALRKITINPGDVIKSSKWEVTYKKTNISSKILPNITKGYYFYYHTDDDETFIDLVFQIKNIDTDTLGISDLVKSVSVDYNGKTYNKSFGLFVSSGDDIDKVYDWDGLGALKSTTLHVAIAMPREIQSNGKTLSVDLTINGYKKHVVVRK